MTAWTVLLKVPDGIHAEVIEADTAEFSEDGKYLEFHSIGPIVGLARLLTKLEGHNPASPEEGEQMLRELLEELAKLHVASFSKDEVAGYYRGAKGKLTLTVDTGR